MRADGGILSWNSVNEASMPPSSVKNSLDRGQACNDADLVKRTVGGAGEAGRRTELGDTDQ